MSLPEVKKAARGREELQFWIVAAVGYLSTLQQFELHWFWYLVVFPATVAYDTVGGIISDWEDLADMENSKYKLEQICDVVKIDYYTLKSDGIEGWKNVLTVSSFQVIITYGITVINMGLSAYVFTQYIIPIVISGEPDWIIMILFLIPLIYISDWIWTVLSSGFNLR